MSLTWTNRIVVAVASALSGYLHWDIWAHHGYRSAPVRELFVAQAVAAVVAGLVALAPIRLAGLLAAGVAAASLVAFALSRWSSVPTLHGGFSERGLNPTDAHLLGVSSTLVILVAEAVAVLGGALLVARPARDR